MYSLMLVYWKVYIKYNSVVFFPAVLHWQEDEIVNRLVRQHGPKCWSAISKHLQGRTGKQCRER